MDCKTSSDLMIKNIEKDIDPLQQADLLEHLGACEACREEYELLAELNDMFEELVMLEPSEGFESRIMSSIDHGLYIEKHENRRVFQPLAISIGIYLTILLGFTLGVDNSYSSWFRIPSLMQQLSWVSVIAERVIIRVILMINYTRSLYNFLFRLILHVSFGSLFVYFVGLIILTSLLVVINTTLFRIIKNDKEVY